MPGLERLPANRVLRVVANADAGELSLFLGAGASKSSGVPLASEMIEEWREMMYKDYEPGGADLKSWCKEQPWYEQADEYSVLFEILFPNERARQKYVEPKIEAGFPNWGYLYLANLVNAGYFNVIFTTNFDDLINDALSMYLAYNPVVCAADSEVMTINIATDRAKIIKLHGDYLFKRLKNTSAELEELDPNMEAKFKEFSKQCGMVVIGYAGRDRSVMNAIAKTIEDKNSFPIGVWWGLRPGEEPSESVAKLATDYPGRFKLFECSDFDAFMVGLHSRRGLNLPETVVKPYESVENRFSRLIGEVENGNISDGTIREHVRQLQKELNRPWAKAADAASSDLLEARLAIGKRQFQSALELVTEYCAHRADDAEALATWGDALALQAEETHEPGVGDAAVAKWREAIRVQPDHLQARYSLARYFHKSQRFREAIEPAEEILELAPNDSGARRNLVQLYAATGRTGDALRLLDEMLTREPDAADLHGLHAAVCEQRGLIAKALRSITRAVELDPKHPSYRFALANGLAGMHRADEAEREYAAAIASDPQNLGFRLQAARFFGMRQQPDKAIQQLQEAVSIEPNSAEARGLLAEVLIGTGRLVEARPHIEAALELSPDDSRLLINAGIVYLQSGHHAEAEARLKRSAELNPQQPQPHYWLAILFWMRHQDAESQSSLDQLQQISPHVAQEIAGQLSMLAQQTGNTPGQRQAAMEHFWKMNAQGT